MSRRYLPILATLLCMTAAPAAFAQRTCSTTCEWGYGPSAGPPRWGEVCCPQCDGRRQSPINIQPKNAKPADLPEIVVSYPSIRALAIHRIAHELYRYGVPLLPRIMSGLRSDPIHGSLRCRLPTTGT